MSFQIFFALWEPRVSVAILWDLAVIGLQRV